MTTMAEIWSNATALENRIERIYSRLNDEQSALDDTLIARAEIIQVMEDIDSLISWVLELRHPGKAERMNELYAAAVMRRGEENER